MGGPPAWPNPMSLTSRKKRPLDRQLAVRDARLVVIACEGEKTEEDYFKGFHSSRIKIRMLPCEDGKSSPEAVFQRIDAFKSEYDLDDHDELWIVIDRDRWTEAMLSQVAQRCVANRINLALSNPCFEVWLALHYTSEIPQDLKSKDAPGFFSALHGGYSKSTLDPTRLMPLVNDAIRNAETLDTDPESRWPTGVGSRVYRIMKSILPIIGH